MSPMNTAKRLQIIAQGFNPGWGVVTGRALKGHQTGVERLSQRNHVVRKRRPISGANERALKAPPTPRTRDDAIPNWRSTPTLQYSITPRGRIRGRGRRRGRERSALSPFTSHLLAPAPDTQSGSARDSAASLPDKHNSRLHKRRWDDGCLKVRSRRKEQRCWRRW